VGVGVGVGAGVGVVMGAGASAPGGAEPPPPPPQAVSKPTKAMKDNFLKKIQEFIVNKCYLDTEAGATQPA
jgi:hypothetical protein